MVKIAQMKNELGNSTFGVRSLWFPPKTKKEMNAMERQPNSVMNGLTT